MEEAREGATGHTIDHVRTVNEGLSGGHMQGGQDPMRDEDDYEEDVEVDFVNQAGTRYSSKPFYTNASELGVRSVGRQVCDHSALVQNGDSLQHHRLGTQIIRARVGPGIGNGWDPGPLVWDPGTPISGLKPNDHI